MCAGKTTKNKETVTVVTASTMQYLTQHPDTHQKRGYCSESLSVVNSCRETPGPIPNPEAKPAHADGTATGRLWESKSPPTPNNNKQLNNPEGKETVNHRLLPLFCVVRQPRDMRQKVCLFVLPRVGVRRLPILFVCLDCVRMSLG